MKRSKVRILTAIAGADFGFPPGSIQIIDADQAKNWEAQGVCSIDPTESLTPADLAGTHLPAGHALRSEAVLGGLHHEYWLDKVAA